MEKMEKMEKITSPLKAIRAHCIECMGGQVREVKVCTIPNCPLYAFRMGTNPYHTRQYTEEQRQAMAERMRKMVEAREASKTR